MNSPFSGRRSGAVTPRERLENRLAVAATLLCLWAPEVRRPPLNCPLLMTLWRRNRP